MEAAVRAGALTYHFDANNLPSAACPSLFLTAVRPVLSEWLTPIKRRSDTEPPTWRFAGHWCL